MDDGVHPGHRVLEALPAADVAAEIGDGAARGCWLLCRRRRGSPRGAVAAEGPDVVAAPYERGDKLGSECPGAAGDEDAGHGTGAADVSGISRGVR